MQTNDIDSRKRRNDEFRALVAMIPGKNTDAKLIEVCAMLGCTINTARIWHSKAIHRVVTQMVLHQLKKAMEYRKFMGRLATDRQSGRCLHR